MGRMILSVYALREESSGSVYQIHDMGVPNMGYQGFDRVAFISINMHPILFRSPKSHIFCSSQQGIFHAASKYSIHQHIQIKK